MPDPKPERVLCGMRVCLADEELDRVTIFEDDALLGEGCGRALRALESTDESFEFVLLEKCFPEKTSSCAVAE